MFSILSNEAIVNLSAEMLRKNKIYNPVHMEYCYSNGYNVFYFDFGTSTIRKTFFDVLATAIKCTHKIFQKFAFYEETISLPPFIGGENAAQKLVRTPTPSKVSSKYVKCSNNQKYIFHSRNCKCFCLKLRMEFPIEYYAKISFKYYYGNCHTKKLCEN